MRKCAFVLVLCGAATALFTAPAAKAQMVPASVCVTAAGMFPLVVPMYMGQFCVGFDLYGRRWPGHAE